MSTSPDFSLSQARSVAWSDSLRRILQIGFSGAARNATDHATVEGFKEEDIPTFILFAKSFRAELPDDKDPCVEYQGLCRELDRMLAAVNSAKELLPGTGDRGVEFPIHNALNHAIASCAVLLEQNAHRVAIYRATGSGSTSSTAEEGRGEMMLLSEKLKEQVEVIQIYLSLRGQAIPRINFEPVNSEVDFKAKPIGHGSDGTAVFKGSFQGRPVAVKRILREHAASAYRQLRYLRQIDHHPNIVRYHHLEASDGFLYMVLQLCPTSLEHFIIHPEEYPDIAASFNTKRALKEINAGLDSLHASNIIHFDIKPSNILIAPEKTGVETYSGYRMLISDYGLCRTVEDGEEGVPATNTVSGTRGWCAPEVMRGEVKYEEKQLRTILDKSLDIFALGCLFYFVLTDGKHPFGGYFDRQAKILQGSFSLDGLDPSDWEARELISGMLSFEAAKRPSTTQCYMHPFFWTWMYKFNFLIQASEEFEEMGQQPGNPIVASLEHDAASVIGSDWSSRLDQDFVETLKGAPGTYDHQCVRDLLRMIRREWAHHPDRPENIKAKVGRTADAFITYILNQFPRLLCHVHAVVATSSLSQDPGFARYFL